MAGKRKTSILYRLILLINLFFGLLLLISYLAPYFNPEKAIIPSLTGLAYLPLLLINIIFIVFWFFVYLRYVLFSVLIIMIGFSHLNRHFQIPKNKSAHATHQLKVVTYNTQNFNSGEYGKNMSDVLENAENIASWLHENKADIICLQEFEYGGKNRSSYLDDFAKNTGCPNYRIQNYFSKTKSKYDGLLTLSTHPILSSGTLQHEGKTICLISNILIKNDTIKCLNIHLASIHLGTDDYHFISDISHNQEDFELHSRNIITKLKSAFIKRAQQAQIIENYLKNTQSPVLIMGDFNDTPISYTYTSIRGDLKDAFLEKGTGFGNTFNVSYFPPLRIDHILCDESFQVLSFNVHQNNFADHFPVTATFSPE